MNIIGIADKNTPPKPKASEVCLPIYFVRIALVLKEENLRPDTARWLAVTCAHTPIVMYRAMEAVL